MPPAAVPGPPRRLLPYGRDALLVDLDDLAGVDTVRHALRTARDAGGLPGVVEIVPAARTVLVVVEPGRADALAAVRALLAHLDPAAAPGDAGDAPGEEVAPVELPVHYDGEDLDLVAADAGLAPHEVVALHVDAAFIVAFGGFAPGFAYLTGLPEPLHQPRLSTPRTRIPAGAVGVAGGFGGVYPRASPGGWRLLGRLTDDAPVLFDPHRDPPALLTPGTRVRFRNAG